MKNNILVTTLEKNQHMEIQIHTKNIFVKIHFTKRFTIKLHLILNFSNTLKESLLI